MGCLVLVHFLCLCAGLSCSLSLPSNVMAPLGSCCHCYVSNPSLGLGLDSPSHKCLPCMSQLEENFWLSPFFPVPLLTSPLAFVTTHIFLRVNSFTAQVSSWLWLCSWVHSYCGIQGCHFWMNEWVSEVLGFQEAFHLMIVSKHLSAPNSCRQRLHPCFCGSWLALPFLVSFWTLHDALHLTVAILVSFLLSVSPTMYAQASGLLKLMDTSP